MKSVFISEGNCVGFQFTDVAVLKWAEAFVTDSVAFVATQAFLVC